MTEELRERVARAICRADGKDPDENSWKPRRLGPDEWETVDVYAPWWMKYQSAADAALSAMPSPWLPLPPVPVEGVAPWDGEFVETARAGGKIPMVAAWDGEDGWTTFNRCYETTVQPHTGKPWLPTYWRPIVIPPLPGPPAVEG